MQQAEGDVAGTVLYSLASSPPYFCNQTQGCASDRAEHRIQCIHGNVWHFEAPAETG